MRKQNRICLLCLSVLLAVMCFTGCQSEATDTRSKFSTDYFDYFDTVTTIVGYENSQEEFDEICAVIEQQLKEYHQLYHIYNRYENLNNMKTINDVKDGSHQTVEVDGRIIDLLLYGKEIYELTEGQTNIAMGSVLSIWHDYRTEGENDPAEAKLPSMEELQTAAQHTDINQMIIDQEAQTVYLADPVMKLDVGGLAKGYAVEQIALYLEEQGIDGYVLNVGGNVRTIGTRPEGEKWTVGIENPGIPNSEEEFIAYLKLSGESVVTSGAYQRYYIVDGKPYHHVIDPDTLMPGEEFLSVSIICNDSGLGDALSTALFSMNFEEGKALIESIEDAEAMWTTPAGEIRYSSGFESYMFEYEK